MDGLDKLKELRTFLSSLPVYKGLRIYHITLADEVKATEFATERILDMEV